eukprot:6753516-Prymnesium_polylepis.1
MQHAAHSARGSFGDSFPKGPLFQRAAATCPNQPAPIRVAAGGTHILWRREQHALRDLLERDELKVRCTVPRHGGVRPEQLRAQLLGALLLERDERQPALIWVGLAREADGLGVRDGRVPASDTVAERKKNQRGSAHSRMRLCSLGS